jgi:multidrug efflux pump subunit AcrA (membrane-fusion protein)
MIVRIQLIGETKKDAVLIPDSAIGADQSNRVVSVVDDKNVVALRTVTTGRLIDGLRVITGGLTGDDWVIVNGLQRARPGAAVTPTRTTLSSQATTESTPGEPALNGAP